MGPTDVTNLGVGTNSAAKTKGAATIPGHHADVLEQLHESLNPDIFDDADESFQRVFDYEFIMFSTNILSFKKLLSTGLQDTQKEEYILFDDTKKRFIEMLRSGEYTAATRATTRKELEDQLHKLDIPTHPMEDDIPYRPSKMIQKPAFNEGYRELLEVLDENIALDIEYYLWMILFKIEKSCVTYNIQKAREKASGLMGNASPPKYPVTREKLDKISKILDPISSKYKPMEIATLMTGQETYYKTKEDQIRRCQKSEKAFNVPHLEKTKQICNDLAKARKEFLTKWNKNWLLLTK